MPETVEQDLGEIGSPHSLEVLAPGLDGWMVREIVLVKRLEVDKQGGDGDKKHVVDDRESRRSVDNRQKVKYTQT